MTKWWDVETDVDASHPAIREAASLIQAGLTVAFPTETVYGLGADARNDEAVKRIYTAKGRPSDNPLIAHIGDKLQLSRLVAECPRIARQLMDAYWPGPLTIVFPAKPGAVSPLAAAGLPTIAVRMPDHPVALALLQAAGCPIVAPSANRSGRPSPTNAKHVLDDLDGKIGGIINGGQARVGIESTVVEVTDDNTVHVLRPGGISAEQLRGTLPGVTVRVTAADEDATEFDHLRDNDITRPAPKSPGMKYAHYAPRGTLTIVHGDLRDQVTVWIKEKLKDADQRGERTGVLTFTERLSQYHADLVVDCGSASSPESVAFRLFDALRQFDEADITCIFTDCYFEEGTGEAVMNRLRKAAGQRIVRV